MNPVFSFSFSHGTPAKKTTHRFEKKKTRVHKKQTQVGLSKSKKCFKLALSTVYIELHA